MCDLAYVLQVEQLERRALVERQMAVTALAAGAKDVKIPDLDEVRTQFDAALLEEPKMVDADDVALRRRLRVA